MRDRNGWKSAAIASVVTTMTGSTAVARRSLLLPLLCPNTDEELTRRIKPGGVFVMAQRLLHRVPCFLALCITQGSEHMLNWPTYILYEMNALGCG
jgi:hypothetical protein